ncbi:pimeloyl-ACP methyl esterase BioG family protein [uncultured Rikenella sp.]|uniref:pimeloyl-ACP methyl esterase BioG family protein n=1 Tax=uncultured Rikenella sp. TaxID=368003 RepID=UPI002614B4FB|nr:pimeloyl-ACP methyl esterase BioG family protein [uncultured Rikenella sp.]
MQAVWINSRPEMRSERGVIVFAAGWAGSDELVRHLALPQGYDLLCLFDYRSLPAAAETRELYAQIAPYRHKYLIAWSFGVWAAERIFGKADLVWDGAVAVNGTPLPVHDAYGIPVRAFAVTVRSIEGAGTGRFLERMCGTPETLRAYYKHRSTRGLEEIGEELRRLRDGAAETAAGAAVPHAGFWTEAVAGTEDAIFPPENMMRYWTEAGVRVTVGEGMPHYPLADGEFLKHSIHEAR